MSSPRPCLALLRRPDTPSTKQTPQLTLSAPRTSLLKGESYQLTCQIGSDLAGLSCRNPNDNNVFAIFTSDARDWPQRQPLLTSRLSYSRINDAVFSGGTSLSCRLVMVHDTRPNAIQTTSAKSGAVPSMPGEPGTKSGARNPMERMHPNSA